MRRPGEDLLVESVEAGEGFWIGTGRDDRIWVRLLGFEESPPAVSAGQRVDISGQVVAHGPGFAVAEGLSTPEGAAQLDGEAAHLDVRADAIVVVAPSP